MVDHFPGHRIFSEKGTVGEKPSRNMDLPYIGATTGRSGHASELQH